ncbi:cysteine proteinase inhibitor 6-like [Zingiber officinale]|uniref:cysteine proteinase inhibitor 6-like n=1 Tax=Zingiber officinale TaxID=94328 RepID=UPI001C4C1C96|nr:cysteine proteinase inhibitor 6-like [Zingiber officinale]
MAWLVGNVRESEGRENSTEIQELARFAVDEHNKKQNVLLEFARVVKAREQVVAGTLHHLTVEAVEGWEKKIDGIAILVPLFWCSLLCRYFGHESGLRGWKTSAARKGANCRSPSYIAAKPMLRQLPHRRLFICNCKFNFLIPYELLKILIASIEVIEEFAKSPCLEHYKNLGAT